MAKGSLIRRRKLPQWRLEPAIGANTGNAANIQILSNGGGMEVERAEQPDDEYNERVDEARRLRRLQIMMSMVMSVISQDPNLTLEEAAEMAANARRAALSMFPDKELAYDILYRPRLQRLMNERFRLQ
jgi:hypothetical protein